MRRAFTLVELLIAIAMMVVMMLGVTAIFNGVGTATGTTQALSTVQKNVQAVSTVLNQDLAGLVIDAPSLLLFCEQVEAHNTTFDELSGAPKSLHRIDTFSFFSRGDFPRQTGGDVASAGTSPVISDMSGSEAWIWYGHLRQYDGSGNIDLVGSYPLPGEGTSHTNPRNYFSSQWILGRECVVLVEPDATNTIRDKHGNAQIFIGGTGSLTPLGYNSGDVPVGSFEIRQSRYDLAGTSVNEYKEKLEAYVVANPQAQYWDASPATSWWDELFCSSARRFQVNTFSIKPLNPARMAQQAPVLMQGVSSFIVEYAGDFIKQENRSDQPNYGDAIDAYFDPLTGGPKVDGTDGETDYFLVRSATVPPTYSRQTRWYGFPRDTMTRALIPTQSDTDGPDGVIDGQGGGRRNSEMMDVVPLRDIILSIPAYAGARSAPFERLFTNGTSSLPPAADYAGMPRTDKYTCAWRAHDRKPIMIRITVVGTDGQGRLGDGIASSYTFRIQ